MEKSYWTWRKAEVEAEKVVVMMTIISEGD